VLKLHVASVCFKCFRCMLQVFYTDVVKVDSDIAHAAIVVHVCCKLLISMLHLFFSTYVASVFIRMFRITHMMEMFYLDVAYVYNDFKYFSGFFLQVV
jgi:hypothetical protein